MRIAIRVLTAMVISTGALLAGQYVELDMDGVYGNGPDTIEVEEGAVFESLREEVRLELVFAVHEVQLSVDRHPLVRAWPARGDRPSRESSAWSEPHKIAAVLRQDTLPRHHDISSQQREYRLLLAKNHAASL